MKKISIMAVGLSTLLLSSCGSSALSTAASILGSSTGTTASSAASTAASTGASVLSTLVSNATSGNNLTNILTSIIGLDKLSSSDLVGTWKYSRPGCAFTSEKTLANAGGEVVAATVKEKLSSTYSSIGIKSSNTTFTFNSDGTFSAKIMGTPWSGTYTFDESTQAITMKGLLLSLKGYTKKNSDGIALLFESKKILSLISTVGKLSGNSTVSNITSITSNYDGVRVGFDMAK